MINTARRATVLALSLLMTLGLSGAGLATVQAAPGRAAVVVSQTQVADRQVDVTVRSDALGGESVGGQGGPPARETFHLDELRPLLEKEYGAGQRRVVAGLSMGGLGALLYAGRNPGMFRAAASYSGMVQPLSESGIRWSSQPRPPRLAGCRVRRPGA